MMHHSNGDKPNKQKSDSRTSTLSFSRNTHFPNLWRHAPLWLTPPSGLPRSPWHCCGQDACCQSPTTALRPRRSRQLLYRSKWPGTSRSVTLGFRRPTNAEQTTSQTSRLHLMLTTIISQYLARSRARQSNYRTTRKQSPAVSLLCCCCCCCCLLCNGQEISRENARTSPSTRDGSIIDR